jgi:hypothetical protein
MENGIERGNRSNFIIGFLLLLFGGLGLINTFIPGLGLLLWAGVFGAAGLAVMGFFATNRSQPGLLIPAYILWAIGAFLALLTVPGFQGMPVPIFILTTIALPFVVGFTRNPANNWGLLIPAYVLLAVAGMLFGIDRNILQDLMIPAYINSAIALPFLITFAVDRNNWWALIPGGIMTAIAVGFLAGTQLFSLGLPALLILMGFAVLFGPMLFRQSQAAPKQEPMLAEPMPKYGPEYDKAPEPAESERR